MDKDPDNPLKALRAEIEQGAAIRGKKASHTLYLSEPQYSQFRAYCDDKGVKPSEVLDRLIALYLAAD